MGNLFTNCCYDEWCSDVKTTPISYTPIKNQQDTSSTNLLSIGVLGTGRSSIVNTLLDRSDVAYVSGGQLRGTTGFYMNPQCMDSKKTFVMNYIDAEGVHRDRALDGSELDEYFKNIRLAIADLPGRYVGPVVLALDVEDRTNGFVVQNLIELGQKIKAKQNAYLILTKWNTNAVQSEWNDELRNWIRKHKRIEERDEIITDPPTPDMMYTSYYNYLTTKFHPQDQGAAANRIIELLSLFHRDNILWAFNLDKFQFEDKMDNELPLHVEVMYEYYRDILVSKIRKTPCISVSELV